MYENISTTWPGQQIKLNLPIYYAKSIDGVPPDGTAIIILHIFEDYVVAIKSFLMAVLLLFVMCCFAFNILYRKRK